MTDSAHFRFDRLARDGTARTGVIGTPRGEISTPAFMPMGTAATVKAMYPGQVRDLGADVVLGNTYHLMLRPGPERMARLGGLHRFMNWDRPILTDSGGFQVMSLSALRKIDEQGVTFRSHIDGTAHHMSPERSIEIQGLLGSDIQMQLDECVRLPADHGAIEKAMHLSLRWAERCRVAFGEQPGRALFGIVQGGERHDLEAAGIGQDRPLPLAELMEPAEPRHALGARAEHQMVGVAQDDVGAEGLDLVHRDCLDRAGRADRHEGGRADLAAGGLKHAGAGAAIDGVDAERQRGHQAAFHSRLASP